MSFKDNEGNKTFLRLHERYCAVNVKYFKQIYFGKFQPKHLTKLAHDYSNWSTDKKDKKDDDMQEATGLNHQPHIGHTLATPYAPDTSHIPATNKATGATKVFVCFD